MDETLNAAQLETMHAAVVRRAKGEPLQYIKMPKPRVKDRKRAGTCLAPAFSAKMIKSKFKTPVQ